MQSSALFCVFHYAACMTELISIIGTELAESLQQYVPGTMARPTSRELKFEVQLYKNGSGSIFVDIQVNWL